jgi:type I restriction enzyme, S subunit
MEKVMKTERVYPKYKSSGVEWLGDVPEHWEVKRLKYAADIIMGQSPNSDDYTDDIDSMPFLQGNADFTDRFPKPRIYCDSSNKIVYREALLISVRAPVGAINEADRQYGIGRGLCAIVPNEPTLKKGYAWFALHVAKEELKALATGSTYDAVSADEAGSMTFLIPPNNEQQSIAAFLDRETVRIDSLVTKKERLIELLREKRSALISHAVTKGLDPSVKLKPSGVEWLGDVPKHWEVKKLKWFYNRINSGDGISPDSIESEGTYPVYGGNGIMGYTENYNSDYDDIIIGRVGAKCGNVYLVPGRKWISDNALTLSLSNCDKFFVLYFLDARNLNQLSNQNAQPLITGSMVGNQYVPLPPLPEQQAIAAFLDQETRKIDALIAKVETVIAKLKEYRTALISAAVTGKIDVREAA